MTHRFLAATLLLSLGLLAAPLFYSNQTAKADTHSTPDLVVDTASDTETYVPGTGPGTSHGNCTDGFADGDCSLREAIRVANAEAGLDAIGFSDAFRIQVGSALPVLTDAALTIDGGRTVHIDGTGLTGIRHGLELQGTNQTVRGLSVYGFRGHGVEVVYSASRATIADNSIGVAQDTTVEGNRQSGVHIAAPDVLVQGNTISRNGENGVLVGFAGARVVIAGNYIGTDAAGTADLGNGSSGVYMDHSASGARVGTNGDGTADMEERNVISGNGGHGVYASGQNTLIAGNYIGTDATGALALGNGERGVRIAVSGGRVGTNGDGVADAAERNVISGNGGDGVYVTGSNAVVAGNYIGTDAAGTAALGNGEHGVFVFASGARVGTNGDGVADAAERNVISGNRDEVRVQGTDAVIAGNYIGTDAAGTTALGDGGRGVLISSSGRGARVGTNGDGTADIEECNVISGNGGDGVYVGGRNAVIAGNYIGTDATGAAALGNGGYGVYIEADDVRVGTDGNGAADAAERNVVSGNGGDGVYVTGSNAVVAGNYIGTDASGTAALGNGGRGVFIGLVAYGARVGTNGNGVADAAERNVISGNGDEVRVQWDDAVIAGNYIGTDAAGTSALGGGGHGVYIGADDVRVGTDGNGTADAAERNVISGNGGDGVYVTGSNAVIAGNSIGTDAAGTGALGNTGNGVFITASGARVGTDGDGAHDEAEQNVISGNGADGVRVAQAEDAVVLGNAIYANGGLGIDRASGGVTPGGAPAVTAASLSGPTPGVSFALASTADRMHRVEVFASVTPDPSGYGEGERFLGAVEVTTDASGDATGFLPTSGLAPEEYVTATATRATAAGVYDRTSEFSRAVLVRVVTLTGGEGWRMLAAPSTSETVGGGIGPSATGLLGPLWTQGYPGSDYPDTGSNVFFYDETVLGGLAAGFAPPASAAEPFGPGRGALVYVYQDDDHTSSPDPGRFPKVLTATGSEPAAPFTFAPTFTASDSAHADGWNLLGNPFAASLDWDADGWTKDGMSNAVYVWDPETEEYLTWNGTTGSLGSGVIAPYQAFWARAIAAPALVAPEASRIGGGTFHGLTTGASSGTPAKTAHAADVVGLRVTGEVGGRDRSNGAWATFSDEASQGLDPFDAWELASVAPEALHLFWHVPTGGGLDIAALPVPGRALKLPLDVSATASTGPLTLSWPTLPEGWRAVLVDKETRRKVNLQRKTSYTFDLAPSPSASAAGPKGRSVRSAASLEALSVPAPRVVGAEEGAAAKGAARSRFVLVLRPPRGGDATPLEELSVEALLALDADGLGGGEAAGPDALGPDALATSAPEALALAAPAPNPSRGAVALGYDVPEAGEVSLVIIDLLGREVVTLAQGVHAPGRHTAEVRAGTLTPGLYVARLRAGAATEAARFTIVR